MRAWSAIASTRSTMTGSERTLIEIVQFHNFREEQMRGTFSRILSLVLLSGLGMVAFAQAPPSYKVDPFWPKELPNNWIMGQVGGMAVDKDDHIWVFQRPRSLTADEAALAQKPPTTICCLPAPSVLQFDKAGNLLKSWGGAGYFQNWLDEEHGIFVDK